MCVDDLAQRLTLELSRLRRVGRILLRDQFQLCLHCCSSTSAGVLSLRLRSAGGGPRGERIYGVALTEREPLHSIRGHWPTRLQQPQKITNVHSRSLPIR